MVLKALHNNLITLLLVTIGVCLWLSSPHVAAEASSPASPNALDPVPLRELYTNSTKQHYFYSGFYPEVDAAQKSYGMQLTNNRPLGYVFAKASSTTRPIYRLKQNSTGFYLMSTSLNEVNYLKANGYALEGGVGHMYSSPQSGAGQVNRYKSNNGWRLAYQSQDESMRATGWTYDRTLGYMLKEHYQVGAYYFGMFNEEGSRLNVRPAARNFYARDDWWAGVKDFYEGNKQGWIDDFSHLKPQIGYYDNSKKEALEQHIEQAASHGLSYFSFYYYWDNIEKRPTVDGGLQAYLAANNRDKLKFTISPCFHASGDHRLELERADFGIVAQIMANVVAEPGFLTTQSGQPLMFMCDSRGIGGSDPAANNEFVAVLKQAVKDRTGKDLYVLQNFVNDATYLSQLQGDGLTNYNDYWSIMAGSYQQYLDNYKNTFARYDGIKPTMRTITQNFSEKPRTGMIMSKDQIRYYRDFSKSKFVQGLNVAKSSMNSAPMSQIDNYATVYAWNEWHEGGIIEPNARDGDYYLRQLQAAFRLRAF